jgi:hypothetical protein
MEVDFSVLDKSANNSNVSRISEAGSKSFSKSP